MSKFAMRDLLIDPETRWVVSDKGSTWVTDRFVMVRGDLFRKVPGPKLHPRLDRPLPVTAVRTILAAARGEGKVLTSTTVAHSYNRSRSRLWRAGSALICLNETVTRTYYLAGLRPRYLPEKDIVAWYGVKRGRDVLMVVQKPVIPFDLRYSELEEAS